MSFFKEIKEQRQQKKEAKKQELRKKNAELRKQGKDLLKGWGQMMDTGAGGFNKVNPNDTKVYFGKKQKRIASETQHKKQQRETKMSDK
ncbi:hypothetical protein [Enterococcus gallinarum]|uniref:hypothetical protein n=1 Tax=Enterococcus gallinarum TaxID=1353 RepID=UPI001D17C65F|nr:hypothetical protein [Enterococcus gallinarum]MCC4043861.1 hypothetical protein [Enterococcus gallinarum]